MGQNPTQLILWTVILYRKIKVHFNRLFVRWLDVRSKYLLRAITLGQWPCEVIYLWNSFVRKKLVRNFQMCFSLSFYIITKLFLKSQSLLLFKLNLLIVPIGKKPAPGDHQSSLNFLCETFPCKMSMCPIFLSIYI